MILNLSSQKAINKFYKRIWLYKSIFFCKTNFICNDDLDIQTKCIIESLNKKNRKERITFVYDKACEIIDAKNEGINICGFKGMACQAHQCIKNKKMLYGCCRKCIYVTPNGCPSKNVACKLFNCGAVKRKYDVYEYKDLKILRVLSLKNRIIIRHDFFSLREDVLKDLYSYSLIHSIFRMAIRMTINFIKVNNK